MTLLAEAILLRVLFQNFSKNIYLKFIYSEKAAKFCEIFTLLLSYVVPVKSKVKISQNFVAFSEYMNFNNSCYKKIFAEGSVGFLHIEKCL